MLKALKSLISSHDYSDEALGAYTTIIEQSRNVWFFDKQGVPDTIDGRFDVIVLHLCLVVHRLRGETAPEAGYFIRALNELFFSDMDRSLREMGVGDTGVGIRIKKMAQAFYGRQQAYEQAIGSREVFKEALRRNLYREDQAVSDEQVSAIADYALACSKALATQDGATLIKGNISFQ